jgi:lipoprotein NlpI
MKAQLSAVLLGLALTDASAWARSTRGDDSQCANTPKPEEAIAACTRLYDNEGLGPSNRAIALGNRGAAYKLLGRYDDAIADFGRAIELNPGNPQYYCQRGDILIRKRAYDEAIADYTAALGKSPKYAWAFAGRGEANLSVGKAQEAVDDITQALKYRPGERKLLFLRGRANSEAKNYAEAVADFSATLSAKSKVAMLPKERAVVLSQRAFALLKEGRKTEAKADADEAVKIAPKNAFSVGVRGLVEEDFGNKGEAKTSYARAVELDPQLEFAKAGLERLGKVESGGTSGAGAREAAAADPPAVPAAASKPAVPAAASKPAAPEPTVSRSPTADLCARYIPQVGTTVLMPCDK